MRRSDSGKLRHRFWRKVIDQAEVRDHGFHGLRHTWVSNMLVGGANPFRVSRAAGHSSFQLTVDVYGHLMPDAKRLLEEFEGGGVVLYTNLCAAVLNNHMPLTNLAIHSGPTTDSSLVGLLKNNTGAEVVYRVNILCADVRPAVRLGGDR
jgi:hypothetical protein